MKKEMKIEEVKKEGARLWLRIDGVTREFFIKEEIKKYSDFSSSLVKAGECISYSATLAEIEEEKYNTYGWQIQTSYEKFSYFRGYAGLEYVVDFHELENRHK